MVCVQWFSQVEAAVLVGVARQAVGRWVKAFPEGGEDALAAGEHGLSPSSTAHCISRPRGTM